VASRRLSFIHRGGKEMASFRYRAQMPAKWLNASLNDLTADTLVFCKPLLNELEEARKAIVDGKTAVVDFCDDHFDRFEYYRQFLEIAERVTCSTRFLAERIASFGRIATAIPESYEFPEESPHCHGANLLWFGHCANLKSLKRILPELRSYNLAVVSNAIGCVEWSHNNMLREFRLADMVVLPATNEYKSPNRAVEAIRQGCFVVAEPHPSLADFPIWKGDITEGIEWVKSHLDEANAMTRKAQAFVRQRYSPLTLASVWRSVLTESVLTLDAAESAGPDGSGWTSPVPTSMLT